MGAATSLMYAIQDPLISAIVVDSSFSDLKLLAK